MPTILEKPDSIARSVFLPFKGEASPFQLPENQEFSQQIKEILKELQTSQFCAELIATSEEIYYQSMPPLHSYVIRGRFLTPQQGKARPYSIDN